MGCAGNSAASRVWKGDMRPTRVIALLAVALLSATSLAALTFSVNGQTVPVPTLRDETGFRTQVVHGPDGPVTVNGITLAELVPLFYDVYRVRISHGNELVSLDGEFAEVLSQAIVFSDRSGLSLWFADSIYENVQAVGLDGTPVEPSRMEVWLSWEGTDLLVAEIERFGRLHEIDMETLVVPNIASRLLATDRAGGEVADLVLVQSDNLPDLVDNQVLQPVDTVLSPSVAAKGADAFSYGSRTWAYPFYFDSHLLFYNTDLVSHGEMGVRNQGADLSWDLPAFERAGESVEGRVVGSGGRARPVIPVTWNAYSAFWLTPFATGFGAEPITSEPVTVNDPSTRAALEYVMDLAERGLLSVMERDAMTSAFTGGRAAMMLSGSYDIPSLERLGVPFAVRPFPFVPETGIHVTPFLDFKGWAVPRRARNPVLARRLLQHLASAGVQAWFASEVRKMPADTDAWVIAEDTQPFFEAMQQSYQIGMPVPASRSYVTYKSLMWRMLRFAFTGRMSVQDVLETGNELLRNAQDNNKE